jgi:hypothetical protein
MAQSSIGFQQASSLYQASTTVGSRSTAMTTPDLVEHKAKLFGDSIQAGSLCYFAFRTSTRGTGIILQTPPRSAVFPSIEQAPFSSVEPETICGSGRETVGDVGVGTSRGGASAPEGKAFRLTSGPQCLPD